MNETPLDISSGRHLNESAVRNHALECSAKLRAGKFTRMGEDFLDEVKADLEAVLRDLRSKAKPQGYDVLPTTEVFVTGLLQEKAAEILNALVARIIQCKVQRQPSCGKTLGRTR